MNKPARLTQRAAWKALQKHRSAFGDTHLRDLFAADPDRGTRFVAEGAGLYLDYSKNRITDETLALLIALADECGVRDRIEAMWRGDKINVTENRSVLHIALRSARDDVFMSDGKNVVPDVHAVLDRMSAFSDRIRNGEWKGCTGKRIRNVVNIGIGGHHPASVIAYEAFRQFSGRPKLFPFL